MTQAGSGGPDRVAPVAFLDDTTTKNVLIHQGRLSGIVDVDVVCYGDPLYVLALTYVALEAAGFGSDYADAWRDLIITDDEQLDRLSLYRAVFALDLLSEAGVGFNKTAEVVDNRRRDRLVAGLRDALLDLASRP